MELTDEMRQAVADEQCAKLGHDFATFTVFAVGDPRDDGNGPRTVLSARENCAPHLLCLRCGRVWLVVETGGRGYDAAEDDLIGRLRDVDPLAERLRERRARRGAPEPTGQPDGEPIPPDDPPPAAPDTDDHHAQPAPPRLQASTGTAVTSP